MKHRPYVSLPLTGPLQHLHTKTSEETNLDTTGRQDGNKAKSYNVPLYLKKIKMSFNYPPRPNKGFAPPVSSHSFGDKRVAEEKADAVCTRRRARLVGCCSHIHSACAIMAPKDQRITNIARSHLFISILNMLSYVCMYTYLPYTYIGMYT